MTKEAKLHEILSAKASAFDNISNLLLTLDSHRNFHRRVEECVISTTSICREIENSRDQAEQFPPCKNHAICGNHAQRMIYQVSTDKGFKVCEQCAEVALASGQYSFEETLSPSDLKE